jgi:ribonuclease R
MAKHKKKKESRKSGALDKKSLRSNILSVFSKFPNQQYNYKQIAAHMLIDDSSGRSLISNVLREMIDDGLLEEMYAGKYRLKLDATYFVGVVEMTTSHNAFVSAEEMPQPVYISHENLNHALHGDTVKICLFAKRKKRLLEGEVIEILKRSRNTFVGVIEVGKSFAFLAPDSKEVPFDFFIPLDKLNGAKHGQKAIVRLIEWPKGAKNPIGEVTEVLGYPGDHEAEMHAIMAEFELPWNFTKETEDAAARISDEITERDYKSRRDFREITTFTIDPIDAKDFDDALSLRKMEGNRWEVGVHIADVSHYVKPDTLIDKEGYDRATSVYLVDRVVPMLPERLSNNICSLRPDEEKLCFSAVFVLDDKAEVLEEWFGKTVIFSNRRFNYDEAQKIIETGTGDYSDEILTLNRLAQIIRQRRYKSGSIGFERAEVKFEIDEKGKPTRVFFKEYRESNQLIEEFMLLANRKVAEFVHSKKGEGKAPTFVYRIHDKPNDEKLQAFSSFVKKFGYSIQTSSNKKISDSINQLLDDIQGKKEQNILENLAIRTMAKAEYSTTNIGHYGLAFKYYTHFTSPIRRYPDIMAHRLLFQYLNGGASASKSEYESMCVHSSDMERKAVLAERSSIKFKQVEFLMDKIGKEFDGVISGITEWGLYIEIIENKCEGLVHIRELKDDFYVFDEDNYSLLGKRNGKVFQLGDGVRVQILRANLAKKQLDFRLAVGEA